MTADVLRLAKRGLPQKQIADNLKADTRYIGQLIWKLRQRGLLAKTQKGRWSDEELDEMRVAIVDKKMSGGDTATHLSQKFGRQFTRNMVIGMAKRHGFELSAAPGRSRSTKTRVAPRPHRLPAIRAAAPPTQPAPIQIAPPSLVEDWSPLRITLLELREGLCRWPLGDPRSESFGFCGAPNEPGKSYCPHCARIAYDSPTHRAALRKAWREARGCRHER